MGNPEHASGARRILQQSALPTAPMAMPEQMLLRPRMGMLLIRPLLQWLTPR